MEGKNIEKKKNLFASTWETIKRIKGGEKWGLKWLSFIIVIFDPWVIILLISTIFLCNKSTTQQNTTVQSYINIAFAISSGLLGGLIAKNFDDFIEESNLLIRGKSAVRDLRYLLKRLASQEKQIRYFSKNLPNSLNSTNRRLIQNYLENIVENYVSDENVVENSIYDWTEIVPEASEFYNNILIKDQKEEEIEELRKKLEQSETDNANNKERIQELLEVSLIDYNNFIKRNGLSEISGSSVGGTIISSSDSNENKWTPKPLN